MPKLNAAFWKWFGDSVVRNADGSPKVMYHWTDGKEPFAAFRKSRLYGPLIFLHDDPDLYVKPNGVLLQCYVRATRIFDIKDSDAAQKVAKYIKFKGLTKEYEEFHEALGCYDTDCVMNLWLEGYWGALERPESYEAIRKAGYDGFLVYEQEEQPSLVVFSDGQIPQIKSTDNDGTWDSDDPDIRSNPPMTTDRARTILTQGGCGICAKIMIERDGGVPLLRYSADGTATHAGVLRGSEVVHFGDDDARLIRVTRDELERAIREDFRDDYTEWDVRNALTFLTGEDYDDPDIRSNPLEDIMLIVNDLGHRLLSQAERMNLALQAAEYERNHPRQFVAAMKTLTYDEQQVVREAIEGYSGNPPTVSLQQVKDYLKKIDTTMDDVWIDMMMGWVSPYLSWRLTTVKARDLQGYIDQGDQDEMELVYDYADRWSKDVPPIVIVPHQAKRRKKPKYEIVDGAHRAGAAALLGPDTDIPAYVPVGAAIGSNPSDPEAWRKPLRISKDGGRTWIRIPPDEGVYLQIKDRKALRDGKIVDDGRGWLIKRINPRLIGDGIGEA
jgi:hypothetical protein